MQIPISQLPVAIRERLQEIQKNHEEYAGFYQDGTGKGWSYIGITAAIFGFIAMFTLASSEKLGWFAWSGIALFNLWILVLSVRYIKRFNTAPIRPFTFLNPLYLTKVDTENVTYYNLWSDREDLNITHNYTNGIYTYTEFDFEFSSGSESLQVSPKKRAEELIELIDEYRVYMLESIETDNYDSIMGHDLFFELEHGDEGRQIEQSESSGIAWKVWGLTAAAALLFGSGFYVVNLYGMQGRYIDRCESYRTTKYYGPIRCLERYFTRHTPNVLKDRAQQALIDAYKKKLENNTHSAEELRKLLETETFAHLTHEQNTALKAHIKDEGGRALKVLYDQAIKNYTLKAKTAFPAARKAIVKLLTIAKDEQKYTVHITYKRNIKATNIRTFTTKTGKVLRIQPMSPSFVHRYNLLRESAITQRVKKSFKRIIPEEILRFDDIPGEFEFNIEYSLHPYSLYRSVNRRTRAVRYYRGIRIFWRFKILQKGKLLYEYLDSTRPAKSFSVRSRRRYRYNRYSRYNRYRRSRIPNSTMYDRMAATAFDNYKRRILVHFGVRRPMYTDLKRRKTWALMKKLGIFKDLAAGKSLKDIDIAARMKAAGMKVPAKKVVPSRRNRYRRNRYRRNRYRRRRYRRNRYRRRYRRPSRRRGNWLE